MTLTVVASEEPATGSSPTAGDLSGTWAGTVSHRGETSPFALELQPAEDGKMLVKMSIPALHVIHKAIGPLPLQARGSEVHLGPFAFVFDAKVQTLSGTLPEALVPVYALAVTLHRVERLDLPERPEPTVPRASPVWTFDAGAPLWAGATFADGIVYAGGEDGRLHALDARTGEERWSFRAGGPIRTRATVAGDDLYIQADDGFLYRLAARGGEERWRVRVAEKPTVRLPFKDPKSRYDRFGSGVTVSGGRLYLGTNEGHLLALDPARGKPVWDFVAGDSVLAAPTLAGGRVYFGSYDGNVYALEAATGRLVWKRDTRKPVVSTPAVELGVAVIGSRSYDLFGLDARTGEPLWVRYIWFSWVESSAAIRDGVAYVGSSDAAAAYAFDVRTGRTVWTTDVFGWAWGQPAVADTRVFVGAASTKGYLVGHRGGVMALERATGRPVWYYEATPAESGSYGFPGSPAIGAGLVFATGLDGRVYAFTQ